MIKGPISLRFNACGPTAAISSPGLRKPAASFDEISQLTSQWLKSNPKREVRERRPNSKSFGTDQKSSTSNGYTAKAENALTRLFLAHFRTA
jgi:hypothetical protein